MAARTYETLLVEVDDGVATLTFNRPEKMNAFNATMTVEFPQAMWALEADDAVRVIVVTGAGRAFCSGIDLEAGADVFGSEAHGQTEAAKEAGVNARSIAQENAFWNMRTPVIGAINGAAVGAGLTVPLLFDIRYAADDAKLGFTFSRRGIVSDANSTWLLPRLVGVERALDLLLTGRMFTGSEAAAMGLVSRALPRDEVLPAALELARDIAVNAAPASVAITKRLVYDNLQQLDREAAFAQETDLIWWAGRLPDAVEGIMSFLEKRPPQWQVSKHIDWPKELDPDA
jgi:enoyl-CoA hydratase/carnithine racemase